MRHLMLVKLNTEFWTDIYNRDRSSLAQINTDSEVESYIQEHFADILGDYVLEFHPTEVYAITDQSIDCINCS